MTKVLTKNIPNEFTKSMKKTLSKTSIRATAIVFSLLFVFSGIGGSVLINPVGAVTNSASVPAASSASPVPAAAAPLSAAAADWEDPLGNAFNQNYSPQNVINSSDAQDLGLNWLYAMPGIPTALVGALGFHDISVGVDTAPLTVNGTTYAVTQDDQAFAFNTQNGDVEWEDVLPITSASLNQTLTGSLVSLHLHDGNEAFTTKLFGNTPTWWISADDQKIYAINAITGKYELNFSEFSSLASVPGNSPTALYQNAGVSNLLVDQDRGIVITSHISADYGYTGRCFYRAFNVLVNPPQMIWQNYCTPPQAGGNVPLNPDFAIQQVNNMSGAEIFYPGPSVYPAGGYIPNNNGQAVINLKTLSPSVLNSTLYNDWGQSDQSTFCTTWDGGHSPGSTAAGWGGPWLLGTGPTAGLAFVNTNNHDPYTTPCTPGPDLWSASILAINETNGNWVWGFQSYAHEGWDYDCSWWQALGNETVNGANTQVIWKTCKDGYLYELNAVTGNLIWAWTPPFSIEPRCVWCQPPNPLNATLMDTGFGNPSLKPTLIDPSSGAGFEMEGAYNPTTNLIYVASQNTPALEYPVPENATNYATNPGEATVASPVTGAAFDNSTIEAINATSGQMVWSHLNPAEGYRGGLTTSGNLVFASLESGDILMLNAVNGNLVRDYYVGTPIGELVTTAQTSTGQEELIFAVDNGLSTSAGVPGDIIALSLQTPSGPSTSTTSATTSTVTSTSTTTVGGSGSITTVTSTATVGGSGSITTVTSTSTSSGVSYTTLYAVAAVAAIFIIVSGYLAMRGRKPPS
jgi:hypothetical protein